MKMTGRQLALFVWLLSLFAAVAEAIECREAMAKGALPPSPLPTASKPSVKHLLPQFGEGIKKAIAICFAADNLSAIVKIYATEQICKYFATDFVHGNVKLQGYWGPAPGVYSSQVLSACQGAYDSMSKKVAFTKEGASLFWEEIMKTFSKSDLMHLVMNSKYKFMSMAKYLQAEAQSSLKAGGHPFYSLGDINVKADYNPILSEN